MRFRKIVREQQPLGPNLRVIRVDSY